MAPSLCNGYSPPFVLTRANRFWFRGQKSRNTGSPCLDKPVSLHGTYNRTHVAGTGHPNPQNMTIQSNRPTHTPEHKSTRNGSYTNTLPPQWTAPAACTSLQTTFSTGLEPQKGWFQKRPKSTETQGDYENRGVTQVLHHTLHIRRGGAHPPNSHSHGNDCMRNLCRCQHGSGRPRGSAVDW